LKDALQNADWKSLEKRKNWDSDTFESASKSGNYVIQVMPRDGDTQEETKEAIERIESAFENYNEGVPYDPLPGSMSGNVEARNSNSFAYTLLRHALGNPKKIYERIGDPGMELPGFDMLVAGMSSFKK
jgi:hypothetical protein